MLYYRLQSGGLSRVLFGMLSRVLSKVLFGVLSRVLDHMFEVQQVQSVTRLVPWFIMVVTGMHEEQ